MIAGREQKVAAIMDEAEYYFLTLPFSQNLFLKKVLPKELGNFPHSHAQTMLKITTKLLMKSPKRLITTLNAGLLAAHSKLITQKISGKKLIFISTLSW